MEGQYSLYEFKVVRLFPTTSNFTGTTGKYVGFTFIHTRNTMNTIDEMIEVLQAIKEGKAIEYQYNRDNWKVWSDLIGSAPDFYEYTFRVKKEQRRHWCIDYTHTYAGLGKHSGTILSTSKAKAEEWIASTKLPMMSGHYTSISEPYEVVEVMK